MACAGRWHWQQTLRSATTLLRLQHERQQPWQLWQMQEAQQQPGRTKRQSQLQRGHQLGQGLAAGQQQRQWLGQSLL
jgi:hypothetical protein